MTINEYQRMALRTESNLDEQKLHHKRLLQGLMGLNGEAGECIDVLKKHLFQDHWFDREHLAKELGDVAWYLAISADAIGYTLEEIFQMNVEKLKSDILTGLTQSTVFTEERTMCDGESSYQTQGRTDKYGDGS